MLLLLLAAALGVATAAGRFVGAFPRLAGRSGSLAIAGLALAIARSGSGIVVGISLGLLCGLWRLC